MQPRTSTGFALLAAASLIIAGCGGGDDDAASPTDPTEEAGSGDVGSDSDSGSSVDEQPSGADTSSADGTTTDGSAGGDTGTYEPGTIDFRTVNLLDQPVDLYVRTTGWMEGFAIQADLAPGAVSDFTAPPELGAYVITKAGTGDPTCVIDCDHFITYITGYPDEGVAHTVVLYDDEYDGPSAFDLWEQPAPGTEYGNAMPPADPDVAMAVFTAIAVTDADFGLRLAFDGTPGCVEPIDGANVLIGGNQTVPFDLTGVSAFTIHDNEDRECDQPPVGGPYTFDSSTGERTHVFLHGSPGSLDALMLEMTGSDAAGAGSDAGTDADQGDSAGPTDRDQAVELMADEVTSTFGLDGDEATCLAELIVDGLGTELILVNGELVDLESLGESATEITGMAMQSSIDDCGIDPAVFGL